MIACNSRYMFYIMNIFQITPLTMSVPISYWTTFIVLRRVQMTRNCVYIYIYTHYLYFHMKASRTLQLASQLVIVFSILVSGTQLRSKQPSNIKLYIIILFRIHWHHAGPITRQYLIYQTFNNMTFYSVETFYTLWIKKNIFFNTHIIILYR